MGILTYIVYFLIAYFGIGLVLGLVYVANFLLMIKRGYMAFNHMVCNLFVSTILNILISFIVTLVIAAIFWLPIAVLYTDN